MPARLLSSLETKKKICGKCKRIDGVLEEKSDNQFKGPFSAGVIASASLRLLCLIGPVFKGRNKILFHTFASYCEPKQIPFIMSEQSETTGSLICLAWLSRWTTTVVVTTAVAPRCLPPRCSDSEVFHDSRWRLFEQKRCPGLAGSCGFDKLSGSRIRPLTIGTFPPGAPRCTHSSAATPPDSFPFDLVLSFLPDTDAKHLAACNFASC